MKIFLNTIGCRLNQAEIEMMAMQFRTAGHQIVASASEADIAVINTCTVTTQAASDSRGKIRQAARLGSGRVAATGCWTTIEPRQAAAMPNVQWVISNAEKDTLVADLLQLPQEFFDLEPLARQPLPGLRARTRAFIKAQDGCDNACTYCITTIARGASRSRPVKEVLGDIRAARQGGAQEIVLTGIHLGGWGKDLDPPRPLTELVSAILKDTDVPRLRLSSLEPWDLEKDFFSLWQDARLCRHLHLPLQSGSSTVLKRMRRNTTPASYTRLVAAARTAIPQVAITTDVIVGFPGETEGEFSETVEFVKQMQFAGGHVFSYSARPGTPAAGMKDQVRPELRKERNAILRRTFAGTARSYRQTFLGCTLNVLWESTVQRNDSGWLMEGLTENNLRVSSTAPLPRWNQIDQVYLQLQVGEVFAGIIREQV